ncbi:general transcription and DNA repair factor IIH helicase subunit XPD isoform X1 [Capsicum chacoense]
MILPTRFSVGFILGVTLPTRFSAGLVLGVTLSISFSARLVLGVTLPTNFSARLVLGVTLSISFFARFVLGVTIPTIFSARLVLEVILPTNFSARLVLGVTLPTNFSARLVLGVTLSTISKAQTRHPHPPRSTPPPPPPPTPQKKNNSLCCFTIDLTILGSRKTSKNSSIKLIWVSKKPIKIITNQENNQNQETPITMKFQLEDITIYFPYDNIYPEQYQYMLELKRTLDAKGHCLLEMPTGTGKTISLLSLITSYRLCKPMSQIKLLYCTRTVHEMEKTLAELKLLYDYQLKEFGPGARMLAIGLSSRKNLCVNPVVVSAENRDSVDAGCRKLTASWVRALAVENPNVPTCSFFENYDAADKAGSATLPAGVYTLQELRLYGKEKGWCPYFLARHMVQQANVVVYSYQYLLDPKVAGIISKEMERECVVVFDEAHNIDNVCIEALSVSVRKQTLEGATRNLGRMSQEIERLKATDAGRLRAEYNRLVEGLAQRLPDQDVWLANPALPDDIMKEAVPGNIRKAEHFLSVLRRFVQYLKGRLETENVEKEGLVGFVASINTQVGIDQKMLKFCYDRLHSLMLTLEITDTDEFLHVQTVCDLATLVGTYSRGFSIIIEPTDERMPEIRDPVLQLTCHDASLAIKPVFERFQSVVITSGTLSPIDLYPRLLNFNPVVSRSLKMSLTRDCICPMVLTSGKVNL